MDKDFAKSQIANLVEKYKDVAKDKDGFKRYNEEMTKLRFINPLFQALGWDIENKNRKDEVTFEDKISKGRVDYGFRLNGIPKFFLEAKALKVNIENVEYVKQAIDYAWNKGCTWAILTDFESIKIFNSEWRASDYSQNHLKTIQVYEFLDRFEELWLLSKESFEKGLLDKEAEKWGKKAKKTPVDKQLLADFTRFRELLSKNIAKLNLDKKLTQEELDEAVQRILDRLIFIRYCEDRELEEKMLISNLREWENRGRGQLIKSLRDVFNYFDNQYNSKIFDKKDFCNNLDIDNEVLHEIIEGLHYTNDRAIFYDFSAIEADVLGNIYEQYLGHILKKTERRATLTESQAHRKEHGIFYTPTPIVDYIVRHTVGKILEDKKVDPTKVRILDPACGSGSFLIRAFDTMNDYFERNDSDYGQTKLEIELENATYSRKLQVLRDHIFGVDLDKQAVEVAQLNLLLKVAEKGRRLPLLQQNIKQGNSLIHESLSPADKAFNWDNEFSDIMNDRHGFDVIIGNPPYVRQEELLRVKPYLQSNYEVYHSMADLFVYFFEREMKLLREEGILGIIVSNKWLKAGYGFNLRKFLKKYWIEQFIDFGDLKLFANATTYPCIIILKKIRKQNPKITVCNVKSLNFDSLDLYVKDNAFNFNQQDLDDNGWNFQNDDSSDLLEKISKVSIPLQEYIGGNVYRGILTGFNQAFVIDEETRLQLIKADKKSDEILMPFLTGNEVRRYALEPKNKYIILTKIGVDIERYPAVLQWLNQYRKELEKRWDKGNYWYELRSCDYYDIFREPKIVYGKITTKPRFTIDLKGYLINDSNFFIPAVDKQLLGILNSKLGWFLVKNTCTQVQGGYQLIWKYFGKVPITKQKSPELEERVTRMLYLQDILIRTKNKMTDERRKIETEAERIDSEIDKIVYELYGLNEKERLMIENA